MVPFARSLAIGASSDAGRASAGHQPPDASSMGCASMAFRPPFIIRPVHRLTFYRDLYPDCSLPRTEDFARRELTLPLHPRMTPATVEFVVNSLAAALGARTARWRQSHDHARALRTGRGRAELRPCSIEWLAARARYCSVPARRWSLLLTRVLSLSLAIWLDSGRPILFSQLRLGQMRRAVPDVQVPQVQAGLRQRRMSADAGRTMTA